MRPTRNLAVEICRRLDDVHRPAYEHVFITLRDHLMSHHGRLGLTAAGLGLIALLMTIVPNNVDTTNLSFVAQNSQQTDILADANPVGMISPASIVRYSPTSATMPMNMPMRPWALPSEPTSQYDFTGHTNLLVSHY
jgi:hypothetical protein